jgi:hypothetical protein
MRVKFVSAMPAEPKDERNFARPVEQVLRGMRKELWVEKPYLALELST